MESSALDDVPGGGNHSNASVLDFCGTEPLKGFGTSPVGEVEGVETLDWKRVSWQAVKASTELSASTLYQLQLIGGHKTRRKCEQ